MKEGRDRAIDPMTPVPSQPLPSGLHAPADVDPELEVLPAPQRRVKWLTMGLMSLAIAVSLGMSLLLAGEVRYAFGGGPPREVGDLTHLTPGEELSNRYVRAAALLSMAGAIRYERPLEGDSFRLAPVAGNPAVWAEIRIPEGMEGPKFVPPTSFAGRLVPLREAGLRHLGLAASLRRLGGAEVPEGAWLLVDGASPRASRWAVALSLLFASFAAWNAAGLVRLAKPRRASSSS
ncbi:MAG: hypothetical protein MUF34_25765 [Polyangiaceae bacterium]|jgi:hypothetical protein|nr:hypothetical protein [Polyangiaceae bacterium]